MTRQRETEPLTQIHSVAETDGERSLLAAVLRLAVTDAQGGGMDAATWLHSDACVALLEYLTPATSSMTGEQLQAQLIKRLPVWTRGGR